MAEIGPAPQLAATFGMPVAGPVARGQRSVLAVGNFDGVHLGHRRLLAAARAMAGAEGRVIAVTFEPHPAHLLRPALVPGLLSPLRLKRRLLGAEGVDRLQVVPFDAHLRELSPGQFLDRLRHLHAVIGMVGGPRLSLGRAGAGGIDFVRRYAREQGLLLEVVDPVAVGDIEVSSTGLRQVVLEGGLESYPRLSGRPFEVLGTVTAGDGLGRKLGFPTANLVTLPSQLLPPDGVYVMTWRREQEPPRPAVGSIGMRPHFRGRDRRFEVHGLGPTPQLYGSELTVEVLRRLRGQMAFAGDRELVAQMEADRRAAREYFGTGAG